MKKKRLSAAINELHTLRDILDWAVNQFNAAKLYYGHGTDNARDEALSIALYVLHLPHDANPAILDAQLTQEERQTIIDLLERRINERIPAAYLTHQAWFAGLAFYVDERVLVPRSPIAELIETEFSPWIANPPQRILDIGTGSGCIAIACAMAFPEAKVDAVDIAASALEVAKINVDYHQVQNRVRLVQSDLFANLDNEVYDLIVSNPPYVGEEELAQLPPEYSREPRLGLAGGGTEGLSLVRRILREAARHLTPKGIVIVEVGNSEEALVEQLPEVPFLWLEFERGGGGVFLLTAEQLKQYKKMFEVGA